MHAGVRMCSPNLSGIYTVLYRCRYLGTLAGLVITRITFPHQRPLLGMQDAKWTLQKVCLQSLDAGTNVEVSSLQRVVAS
jgi:hypothetical protein